MEELEAIATMVPSPDNNPTRQAAEEAGLVDFLLYFHQNFTFGELATILEEYGPLQGLNIQLGVHRTDREPFIW